MSKDETAVRVTEKELDIDGVFHGVISKFTTKNHENGTNGFGFITPDNTSLTISNLYFHENALSTLKVNPDGRVMICRNSDPNFHSKFHRNKRVVYITGRNEKGRCAYNVFSEEEYEKAAKDKRNIIMNLAEYRLLYIYEKELSAQKLPDMKIVWEGSNKESDKLKLTEYLKKNGTPDTMSMIHEPSRTNKKVDIKWRFEVKNGMHSEWNAADSEDGLKFMQTFLEG